MCNRPFSSRNKFLFAIIIFNGFILGSSIHSQEYTLGIGNYPGRCVENYAPLKFIDSSYGNVALFKAAYHSSSYDYNLTSQLVTDGIIESRLPGWVSVFTSQEDILPRNKRLYLFDNHPMTSISIDSSKAWVQINLEGGNEGINTDSIVISGSLLLNNDTIQGYSFLLTGSLDGVHWIVIDSVISKITPGDSVLKEYRQWTPSNMRVFNFTSKPDPRIKFKRIRVEFNSSNVESWRITEFKFFRDKTQIREGGPYGFTSAWMSGGNEEEWIMIDLGGLCTIDRINLYWILNARSGMVQTSADGKVWKDIKPFSSENVINLEYTVNCRFVRLFLYESNDPAGYILSEIEILGRNRISYSPKQIPQTADKEKYLLSGGNWKLTRASCNYLNGEIISTSDYDDSNWLEATVPATTLASYFNIGAIPDPNFGDNQFMISDSYFFSDFWYRCEFQFPEGISGDNLWLNFNGINWKAKIFLNGHYLGNIEGAFRTERFNITSVLYADRKNILAILVEKNNTPGYPKEHTLESPDANGGELGGDNPTFHASVGWDWIPTIKGRNTGIYDEVSISRSGPVTIHDPFLITDLPLPSISYADITVNLRLQNHQQKKIRGLLLIEIGDLVLEKKIEINGSEFLDVKFDPSDSKSLHLKKPLLWWPNGYGEQNLYDVHISFITEDQLISDQKKFKIGIREITYSNEKGALRIWINGIRFIGRGGNWGFPESMLRYRDREYNAAVEYHKEMNFNIIRNWVGQTSHEAFFEACDRNGIMVWQDFWLANPVDGPNPHNEKMFLANADNFVRKIRNHPSIILYCGRNEGYPPDSLNNSLRNIIQLLHPGIYYLPNSAWDEVSGGGPYRAFPSDYYFHERATPKFHSEMGRPCVVNKESLDLMMCDSALNKIGRLWGVHDFCYNGAQRTSSFLELMNKSFGNFDSISDWIKYAQWLNYDGYRSMFEAQAKNRMGLLLWMSHSAWPSLVWQTYDYFLDPTAAYFGCKKGSEPIHIQWNPETDSIEVVNYSYQKSGKLKALMEMFNSEGALIYAKSCDLTVPVDSRRACMKVEYPEILSGIYFQRLKLLERGQIISENIYWRGKDEGNLHSVRDIKDINLSVESQITQADDSWYITTTLRNGDKAPALLVHLQIIKESSGERILPVLHSDNYVTLMPQEVRIIHSSVKEEDTGGEKPQVKIEGINLR